MHHRAHAMVEDNDEAEIYKYEWASNVSADADQLTEVVGFQRLIANDNIREKWSSEHGWNCNVQTSWSACMDDQTTIDAGSCGVFLSVSK